MTDSPVRTRFAPSPTGDLHLGNARTALFNWLFARRNRGTFVVRSEDTDRERSDAAALERILADLDWLGLAPDEGPVQGGPHGPYCQHQRGRRHQELLNDLLARDLAYPCYCTREELAAVRKRQIAAGRAPRYPGTCAHLTASERAARREAGREPTLRFRVEQDGEIAVDDLVHGRQTYRLADIGDFIVARADGTPAFFFANAVDDADMDISHVLRGDDHLTNTPRQLLLLRALGLRTPEYGHFGLITTTDGRPLSKRTGADTVAELRTQGYRPEAVRNHLARIGVSGLDRDLLGDRELAAGFDLVHVSRGPASHDPEALEGWQRRALDHLDDDALLAWLEGAWPEPTLPWADADTGLAFVRAVRPNVLYPREAAEWAQRILADVPVLDAAAVAEIRAAGEDFFTAADAVAEPAAEMDFRGWAEAVGRATWTRGRHLFRPLRAAISGALAGPELGAIVPLIGQRRLQQRLQRAAAIARDEGDESAPARDTPAD